VGRTAGIGLAVAFLVIGYALLAPLLRGSTWRRWLSFGGIAMLVGAALSGVTLCVLVTIGVRATLGAFVAAGAVLIACGLALAWRLPAERRRAVAPSSGSVLRPTSLVGDIVETTAMFAVVAILAIALVGAFRSTPWLDDTWFFWLPKGLLLSAEGLDPRLFAPNMDFDYFARNDNPLWWSIVLSLVTRLSGDLDLHAINVLQACFLVAFVGAVARILATRVRPELLWPGLLLLVAAPELLRQLQSGAADITMAIFLVLAALAAALWLVEGELFLLLLVVPMAAGGIAGKGEGLPQLLLYIALVSAVVGRGRVARLGWLWGAVAVALATLAPWLVWRRANDVENVYSVRDSFNPAYLLDHTDRLDRGLSALTRHYTQPREWSLIVPVALVLSAWAWWRWRSAVALFPALFVGATFAFWTWLIWADPQAHFRVGASSYRYVDPAMIGTAVCVPLLLEAILRGRRRAG
jgi:hypothetical protein